MRQLAAAGRRDFYEGSDRRRHRQGRERAGRRARREDLRRYQARIVEPIVTEYRGAALALAPGLTAGPSMRRALHGLRHERFRRSGPHADAFLAYARVLRDAYSERLATMGETSRPSALRRARRIST